MWCDYECVDVMWYRCAVSVQVFVYVMWMFRCGKSSSGYVRHWSETSTTYPWADWHWGEVCEWPRCSYWGADLLVFVSYTCILLPVHSAKKWDYFDWALIGQWAVLSSFTSQWQICVSVCRCSTSLFSRRRSWRKKNWMWCSSTGRSCDCQAWSWWSQCYGVIAALLQLRQFLCCNVCMCIARTFHWCFELTVLVASYKITFLSQCRK